MVYFLVMKGREDIEKTILFIYSLTLILNNLYFDTHLKIHRFLRNSLKKPFKLPVQTALHNIYSNFHIEIN